MNLDMFSINVNFTILVALVGVVEFIKKQDYKLKLKPFYWLISLVLNILVGVFVTDWIVLSDKPRYVQILQVSANIFTYFGISTLLYQYILKVVQTIMEKLGKKPADLAPGEAAVAPAKPSETVVPPEQSDSLKG